MTSNKDTAPLSTLQVLEAKQIGEQMADRILSVWNDGLYRQRLVMYATVLVVIVVQHYK